jgi:hypothetical protein
MIDGVVRDQVEEAIRFLQAGAVECFEINEHHIGIVALAKRGHYLAVCLTCKALVVAEAKKPYLAIHKHVGTSDAFDAPLVRPVLE